MAEVCRTALQFQARPPRNMQKNPEIQTWLNEQLNAAMIRSEEWYSQKAAEVQYHEEAHSDIRYELLI